MASCHEQARGRDDIKHDSNEYRKLKEERIPARRVDCVEALRLRRGATAISDRCKLSLGEHSALWLRLALVHAAILDTVALAAGQQQCESQDRYDAHWVISRDQKYLSATGLERRFIRAEGLHLKRAGPGNGGKSKPGPAATVLLGGESVTGRQGSISS
jgi:hypothetical protein